MATSQSTIASEDKVQTVEEIAAENEADKKASEASTEDNGEGLILGKFKTQEDLAAAYTELEKRFSSGDRKTEGTSEDDKSEETKEGLGITPKDAEEAVEEAGLDFDALSAKYAEKGELEESDYEALEKSGLKRSTVDQFIRGQEALAKQYEETVLTEVGGRESYSKMTEWAADNLSEAQIETFNDAVNSGDVEKAKFAITALKAQYESANGTEAERRVDGQPSKTGPRYESKAEWLKDMEDPRYWNDASYREKVERKFANSTGI